MDDFAIHTALVEIWSFIGAVNRYVDAARPWALAKDPARRPATRGRAGDARRRAPVPRASCSSRSCRTPPPASGRRSATRVARRLRTRSWGTPAARGPGRAAVRALPASRHEGAAAATRRPSRGRRRRDARISIDEFKRLDLRVAEVVAAEPVPKSKKLLKLTVRLGEETRTLVAGIAEHYRPDALVGRKVVVVANLEPATLMGVSLERHGARRLGGRDTRAPRPRPGPSVRREGPLGPRADAPVPSSRRTRLLRQQPTSVWRPASDGRSSVAGGSRSRRSRRASSPSSSSGAACPTSAGSSATSWCSGSSSRC